MEVGSVLKVVFGAVASCALVHIGFAAFGVEPLLHAAGDALTGGVGEVAHSCGLDHVFNEAASVGGGADIPEYEFSDNDLMLSK